MIRENDLLNEGIRSYEVRLITATGEQVIVTKQKALEIAREEGLDLFLVSPEATPPVAKILNYGQYRYQKEKKQKETNKKSHQKSSITKELKLSPRIGGHDFDVRVKQGRDFLSKGYKVKLTVFFKGREAAHYELGHEMIARYLAKIEDLGWAEAEITPQLIGKMMSIVIIAGRKKPVPELQVQSVETAPEKPKQE